MVTTYPSGYSIEHSYVTTYPLGYRIDDWYDNVLIRLHEITFSGVTIYPSGNIAKHLPDLRTEHWIVT